MIFGYGCQNGLALLGGVANLARRVVALAMAWVPQINGRLARSSPRQGADIGADQVKQSRLMTT